jgi:chromosome segregation protein
MHFKRIEMIGFKSFADRTIVDLDAGMTAVVGPNGCGKSNILDAMRWALGEQKPKTLRGAHMQDVIFNGSEERAAMGMAEVTLTFDNSDGALPIAFNEVQVARRVYRSGESEYLINQAPCRLRDVQELFMDTGIGTNAYSMIGQGKIGMVLSSKPEDRRFLFEEAAGIIKYKSRKKIALRKLDSADQNLLRLGDIVHEVERQMRSLKRQVNAAIRHRELTAQLRELEIRASWLKQRELGAQLATLKERFAQAQDTYEKKSAEMSELEARHEVLSLSKLEADRNLHARRESVHEIDTEMEKIERHVALVRQQIEFSREQEQKAAIERTMLEQQAGSLGEQGVEVAARLETLRVEQTNIGAVLAARQADLALAAERMKAAEAGLEECRGKTVDAMNQRGRMQTVIETLTVTISHMEEQLGAIDARRAEDEQQSATLREAFAETEAREQNEAAALAGVEVSLREAHDEERRLRDEREAARVEWQALREERGRVEARLLSFRELRDSYEGFADGVRAIMQARQSGHASASGVVGPVGDLVRTAPAYERAVEAALGAYVNGVVVERGEDAAAAIAHLAEQQAGRVTFIPLDAMPAPAVVEGDAGTAGRALLELVNFDERYSAVVRYLLGDIYLVYSLSEALRLSREAGPRRGYVTAAGDVVLPSGVITGGRSAQEDRGLLGRSAEIERLEVALADVEFRLGHAAWKAEDVALHLAAQTQQREELTHRMEATRAGRTRIAAERDRLSRELERLAKSMNDLAAERAVVVSRREDIAGQRSQNQDAAAALELEAMAHERAFGLAQEASVEARSVHAGVAGVLADLRVHIAELSKSVEETAREHQRVLRERAAAQAEAGRRAQAIEDFRAQCVLLESDAAGHLERSKGLSEAREEARRTVVEAENRRQEVLDESDTIEKALRLLRDEVREAQNLVHRIEMDLRHDEDQLEFFRERILNEYHVALASLTEEEAGADEYDAETREKMVAEIRERLERLGPVNLMAIEEHDALVERHTFLVAQDQDLRKARESLLSVIERIDKTITAMFLETFNAVAENFKNYFRRLFNGGTGRLYLMDENDPLECGIEIEARPPGKKPQSIMLLSGGEQAMTAIALLFGIFKAKPSPFCVLDEVDAPLDDANIGRFVSLVEEFTADTQFVVITHNKQTMAQANGMYGVTQQERGVSQIVSVRFGDVREGSHAAA